VISSPFPVISSSTIQKMSPSDRSHLQTTAVTFSRSLLRFAPTKPFRLLVKTLLFKYLAIENITIALNPLHFAHSNLPLVTDFHLPVLQPRFAYHCRCHVLSSPLIYTRQVSLNSYKYNASPLQNQHLAGLYRVSTEPLPTLLSSF